MTTPPLPWARPITSSQLVIGLSLLTGLLALFLLCHPYYGIRHDAVYYVLAAIRKMEPGSVDADVFFSHGSQDSFTIFTTPFCYLIKTIGLANAAHVITRLSSLSLIIALWFLARNLLGAELAWLSTALFIIIPGHYGAGGIFRYDEDFATPRTLAELLCILSLNLLFLKRRWLAITSNLLAIAIHPLMGFPGLLVSLWLVSGRRTRWFLVLLSLLTTAFIIALAFTYPIGPIHIIDDQWRRVIETNEANLLVDTWSITYWQSSGVAAATLIYCALSATDAKRRNFSTAALCVASSGIALAALAAFFTPVHLFIEGQPWRWTWIAEIVAVILIPPTVLSLPKIGTRGYPLTALFIIGWFNIEDPVGIFAAGCFFFAGCVECLGSSDLRRFFSWINWATALTLTAATLKANGVSGELRLCLVALLIWLMLFKTTRRHFHYLAVMIGASGLLWVILNPKPIPEGWDRNFDNDNYASFSAWRQRIRPNQIVFSPESVFLPWLMLHRPEYAGKATVVFSRDAAIEFEDQEEHYGTLFTTHDPLSVKKLITFYQMEKACLFPNVAFIATRHNFEIPHLSSTAKPPYADLKLYSCEDVRTGANK